MKRKKLIRLPHLNDAGGDTRKQWYVEYAVRNPKTDKMERFRVYDGLTDIIPEKRRLVAEKIIQEYTTKLLNGWSPLGEPERYVYEDQLVYTELARVYGQKRASNETVRFFASEWIREISPRVNEESTIPTYKGKLRHFCNWLDAHGHGQNDVTSVTNDVIIAFFDYIIDDQKLSGNSVSKYKQILTSLFDSIIKRGKLKDNPVRDVRACNRINDQAPRPIMEQDLTIFREAIKPADPQLWLAICFEYYCFLRPGKEIRLMKIGDIDFARGIVRVEIEHSKTVVPKNVTIPFVFLKDLRETYQLHTYPRQWFVFGKNGQPGTEHLGKNNMRYRFNRFRAALKMPTEYKFYSPKHTGNSRADDCREITIRDRQIQNGHASIKTTEIYTRNKFGSVNKAIQQHFPSIDV